MLRFSLLFTLVSIFVCSALVLLVQSRPVHKDFYNILGVSRSATEAEIKKTYKGLARKLHPDRAPKDKREEIRKKFIEVTEAYEILSDDEKRKKFDETGWGMQGNEDRQYLKHHLFNEDFDGKQMKEKEMHELMNGQNDQPHLVFFWSPTFPDCIDASKPYRQLASKLKGTSIIAGSYKCDDNPVFCRDLALGAVPKLIAFPVKGTWRNNKRFAQRFELQSLLAFASDFLNANNKISMPTLAPSTWFDRCPNPQTEDMERNWMREYFFESNRQSKLAEITHDFVAFSTGPCLDCDTEMNYARETLGQTLPHVKLAKADCESPEGRKMCKKLGFFTPDRAWTVARLKKRCWYATKKPFKFSNENCETETQVEKYQGKYDAGQFLNFIFGPMITTGSAITTFNGDDIKRMKEGDDAFVAVYSNRRRGLPEEVRRQLTLLSLYTARNPPKVTRQGKDLYVKYGVVECNELPAGACDDVKGRAFPQMAVYPFTKKAKKGAGSPKFMDDSFLKESGFMSMIRTTLREAEPLRIHVLNNNNFDKKKAAAFERGKRFFVMFGAGEWCPPCMDMKPKWPQMAREIKEENKKAAKQIVIGQVDCDKERALCVRLGIEGFPSMLYFAKDRPQPTRYGGGREVEALKSFAIEQLESRVVTLEPREIMQRTQQGGTLLVDFSAGNWCPPCTAQKPIFKKASGLIGDVEATIVDCDENGQFCQMFQIDGFPTIMLFHKGKRHTFELGIQGSPEQMAAWVKAKMGGEGNKRIGK